MVHSLWPSRLLGALGRRGDGLREYPVKKTDWECAFLQKERATGLTDPGGDGVSEWTLFGKVAGLVEDAHA